MALGIISLLVLTAILVAIKCLIRYAVNRTFDKAGDAIHNAVAKKRNQTLENQSDNLADRYK